MQSIRKILVANRGEIARRVNRTAKSMGISTVAIFTDEERDAVFVREADQAFSLGSGSLAATYLNISLIIDIALSSGCDAIHPGYGFLSENAAFAQACKDAGIIFIGPEPETIWLMGNKSEARKYVEQLGIPLPPSVKADSLAEVLAQKDKLKFPVMIKAVAGGGGKGMKIVQTESELTAAWESAQREALAYFGNAALYIEQCIEDARHIEVQVLGDHHGNVLHLYERECSIQRRHQKIIEEAPSVTLSETVREKLLSTALHIAKSMQYTSAGTLEFLFDRELNFYFLEMNTRIQVEHPVTEAITGVDIVKEQIRIAEEKPFGFSQQDISINGHAIECRVYAEDPFAGFIPSAGEMLVNYLPASKEIRLDSAFERAAMVSSAFDPMIAKITAQGKDRREAVSKLRDYLNDCAIQGIKTNIEYLSAILRDTDFLTNNISTDFCHHKAGELKEVYEKAKNDFSPEKLLATVLAYDFLQKKPSENIWQQIGSWRFPGQRVYNFEGNSFAIDYQLLNRQRISFNYRDKRYLIEEVQNQEPVTSFLLNGERQYLIISEVKGGEYLVSAEGITFQVRRSDLPDLTVFDSSVQKNGQLNGNHVLSPLNGKVIKLNVKKGDKVRKGELLLIIESMKMEKNILAPAEAVVTDVMITNGAQVSGKELLIKLTMAN